VMFHFVVPPGGSKVQRKTRRFWVIAQWLLAFVATTSLMSMNGSVAAHSDFVGSEPPDGSVLAEPLQLVVLNFAVPVLGDGATVVAIGTSSGSAIEGVVSKESATAWRATFAPALQGEVVRVEFGFRAEDGHLVEAAAFFDLTGATTTTTLTAIPTTTRTTVVVAPAGDTESDITSAVSSSTAGSPSPSSDAANHIARLTQNVLGFALVGGLFFALYIWRRNDVLPTPKAVAVIAVGMGVASILEIATIARQLDLVFSDAVTHQLAQSPAITLAASIVFVIAALSVLAGQVNSQSAFRLMLFVPMLGVIVAPAFDGHTVTKGPRLAHTVSDIVHMGSATIWVGSVLGLLLVARVDRQKLASVAQKTAKVLVGTVAAVAVSGVVMTLVIIDGMSSLTDSTWGRILMVKLFAVATAGAIGGVHHWRVVPRLRSGEMHMSFRRTIVLECAVLTLVIVASSWLVVAMP
jgi:copper transport protein